MVILIELTQNNNRADRKMESNDSPEIPVRGEDIRRVRPPFGPTEEYKGGFVQALNIDGNDQKMRN